MILVTGGAYSGKTYFIKQKYKLTDEDFISAEYVNAENIAKYKCVYDFHKYIEKNIDSNEHVLQLFRNNEDIIVELREVGSGIVPIDEKKRKLREVIGRTGCILADNADEVYRLVCANAMKLK